METVFNDDEFYFDDLPTELLEMVLSELDTYRQHGIRRTCTKWDELICKPHGACRPYVRLETDSGGWLKPCRYDADGDDESDDGWESYLDDSVHFFNLCIGVDTREVVIYRSVGTTGSIRVPIQLSASTYAGYHLLLVALLHRCEQLEPENFLLPRLTFVNAAIPTLYMNVLSCCPKAFKQICFRKVILMAMRDFGEMFVMEAEINVKIDVRSSEQAHLFGAATMDDFVWDKYVAQCAGALCVEQEQLVLNSLHSADLFQKLMKTLQTRGVVERFSNNFRSELESMDSEDIGLQWLRKLDVWTTRFLFHYFASVCNLRPVTHIPVV